MRKLIVGLVAVALLAVAAPAIAQQADSLGLIASGAVVPFIGNGTISPGSVSFLEIYAPVVDAPFVHAFFYDSNCNKGPNSLPLGLTRNDIRVQQVTSVSQNLTIPDGLLTIGAEAGFHLDPLTGPNNPGGPNFPLERPFRGQGTFGDVAGAPIHARMLWINPALGPNLGRVLEPIAISHYELQGLGLSAPSTGATAETRFTWNPLRSAHTFHAPLEGGGTSTFIFLVCPTTNIIGPANVNLANPAFQTDDFPPLWPPPVVGVEKTPLDADVYDVDEHPLANLHFTCSCLQGYKLVTDVSPIYGDAAQAPLGTYTELLGGLTNDPRASHPWPPNCSSEGEPIPPCERYSFTGYRAIRVATNPVFDLFGRLHNGNACVIKFQSNHEFAECGIGAGTVGTPVSDWGR